MQESFQRGYTALVFIHSKLKQDIRPLITGISTNKSCIQSMCQAISPVHVVMLYSTNYQNAIPYVQSVKERNVQAQR